MEQCLISVKISVMEKIPYLIFCENATFSIVFPFVQLQIDKSCKVFYKSTYFNIILGKIALNIH